MVETDDIVIGVVILMLFLFLVSVVTFITDEIINNPTTAEDAINQCRARGFDSYLDYKRVPFTTTARGVRCQHPIKQYDVDLNQPLIDIEK